MVRMFVLCTLIKEMTGKGIGVIEIKSKLHLIASTIDFNSCRVSLKINLQHKYKLYLTRSL